MLNAEKFQFFLSVKKLIVVLFLVMLLSTTSHSQSGWIEQPIGYPVYSNINSIYFFDSQTGFIVGGNGVFARTTNGGTNWIKIPTNINNHYSSISFINDNTGWVSGGFYNSIFTYELIKKTTNKGITWDSLYFEATDRLKDIQFIDNNTGYVAGKYLKKTTNGGLNWFVIDDYFSAFQNSNLHFINGMTGWANKIYFEPPTNLYISKLIKTTNGGQNWITQISDSSYFNNTIRDIKFLNENTGYLSFVHFGIKKTTNGGQNWESKYDPIHCYKIFFLNDSVGWVGSESGILKTTNSGKNWAIVSVAQNCSFDAAYFVNEITGWAMGTSSNYFPKLFKTTNGGVGIININSEIPSSYSLLQNYPNPFNPTTNIKFQIAKSGNVKLIVFDILGKEVATLINESLQPGTYETTFDASNIASGIYFYKLITDGFSETKRMIAIK